MIQPRDYQIKAHEDMRNEYRRGNNSVLLYAPTGSGKTIIASSVIKSAYEKGSIIWFICHRRELVFQASNKLSDIGLPHGLILAGEEASESERIQVVSVQTLQARFFKRNQLDLVKPDVVVFDECHHVVANTFMDIINLCKKDESPTAIIGLTATPVRADGKGLGGVFKSMVRCPGIDELTQQGFLVPVRYFAPSIPDLMGVKVLSTGDYNMGQLETAMNKKKLVGDIVTNWMKICPDRKTVIFSTTVAHSLHIKEKFEYEGIDVGHIDGGTPKDERDETLQRLKAGDIQVLTNCQVLTEGWDEPSISCCILARPTKSLGLYLQMAGRVLRPWEGKTDTILIDHSGAVYEHGFLNQDFPWSLEENEKISKRLEQQKEKSPSKVITCEMCYTIYEGQRVCPNCGHVPVRKSAYVSHTDGMLGEIRPGERRSAKSKTYSPEEKQTFYQMLKYEQKSRGYKDGWTANQYREKFGVWPHHTFKGLESIYPNVEVSQWLRHQRIKYAKRMEKEKRGDFDAIG